jgi:hypothetical protein
MTWVSVASVASCDTPTTYDHVSKSNAKVHPRRAKGESILQRARPALGGTIC